jgi:hypothetical protein
MEKDKFFEQCAARTFSGKQDMIVRREKENIREYGPIMR